MKHRGRVLGSDGDGATIVALDSLDRCLRCSRGEGCGALQFTSARSGVTLRIKPQNLQDTLTQQPTVGQSVDIEIDDQGSAWLWPVFGAYGLPLLGMLLATGVASALTGAFASSTGASVQAEWAELIVLASAIAGLCGGLFAWRLWASGAFSGVRNSVLVSAERGLCLQSARIVAIDPPTE